MKLRQTHMLQSIFIQDRLKNVLGKDDFAYKMGERDF